MNRIQYLRSVNTVQWPKTPQNVLHKMAIRPDAVHFGTAKSEFQENGQIYTVLGGSEEEGSQALSKLMEARVHAATKQKSALKNPTNDNDRHYGALLVFDNGQESVSTNICLLRQRFRCDVDIALHQALNEWMEHNKSVGQTPAPKVTAVYLAAADSHQLAPVPCEDCYEWFNTDLFSADTKVYKLEDHPAKNCGIIQIQTIQDLLPIHKGRNVVQLTEKPIHKIPLQASPTAQKVLDKEPALSTKRIYHLLREAQKAYEQNQKAFPTISNQYTGAATIVSPFMHMVVSSGRFEWARRWIGYPDLTAAQQAFQKTAKRQDALEHLPGFAKKPIRQWLECPKVKAVAYYGNDVSIPTIGALGRLRRHRGSDDTLVITIENDTIQVRTIKDYLPVKYETPPISLKSR